MEIVEYDFKDIKTIGFDADDTLWVNETYFREAEQDICKLLSCNQSTNEINQKLYKTEIKNLPLYGYGIKGFILSMIEKALEISNQTISNKEIYKIIDIGKAMLNKPVELLPDVENVLKSLSSNYQLIVLTKGDLLDQERKLEKSGLLSYFYHIEVLSDKKAENYSKTLKGLNIKSNEFLMIGNSLKSDILPIISIGAKAIHIPFHTTWQYEMIEENKFDTKNYLTLKKAKEILKYLN